MRGKNLAAALYAQPSVRPPHVRILSKQLNTSQLFHRRVASNVTVFPHQTLRQYPSWDP